MTDAEIRVLDDATEMRRVATLFSQVWGSATPPVGVELLRAVQHAGGYVVAAYADEQVVGGSFGFLGRHDGQPSLHSHITGVLPGVRHTGVGRAVKLHQRAWAADHGLAWVTWTFDPLVRRNAHFNIDVLGVRVHEYLVDFYGPIDDAINAGDESDRLLVAWSVVDVRAPAPSADTDGAVAVPTPEDIVILRRTDGRAAASWRQRLRDELGARLAAGGRVVGFTDTGEYLVVPAP
jgi:predicted GNAT superfamily acetyltransferase